MSEGLSKKSFEVIRKYKMYDITREARCVDLLERSGGAQRRCGATMTQRRPFSMYVCMYVCMYTKHTMYLCSYV